MFRAGKELVAGDHRDRDRRQAASRLLAAHDRVEEAVVDAARRGEGHAVEGGQASHHLVELAAVRAVKEDGLHPA